MNLFELWVLIQYTWTYKILWGLWNGCKFSYPDLYILVSSPNTVLICSFISPNNRLCRHSPVLVLHLQFCLLKKAASSKITKSCQTLAHRLWTRRQKLKQNFNHTLGIKPTTKAMEFHSSIKCLLYHSNSQGCAAKAVASLPHLLVPNNQPWEPVRGKWLGRLGKAPEPVTWGFCLTAADRAGAALGNLPLANDFNEEKSMAPSQYFLNFRSESTRYFLPRHCVQFSRVACWWGIQHSPINQRPGLQTPFTLAVLKLWSTPEQLSSLSPNSSTQRSLG